jgi:predicted permease
MTTIRHALRRLARAPGFTAAALLTLTLGIGATAAVFTVVNAVLLRPLPYPRGEQLVDLSHTLTVSGISRVDQSDATFLYYAKANRVFSDVGAYRVSGVNVGRVVGSSGDGHAERVNAGLVSASMFATLRATPLLGRTFRNDENLPGAPRTVVIGQQLWERKFGGDRSVVGTQLEIDGVTREVIGVMPAGFDLPAENTDLWLPITIDPTNTASAAFDYRGIGRLKPGVPVAAAAADLQQLLPHVPEAYPGRLTVQAIKQIKMQAVVRPLRDVVVGDVSRVLWVVLGAVACVLLVACANVMNLFLVRAEGRQHELAVRRALGADRRTLAAEHIVEAAILAVVGGVLAVGVAIAGVRALKSLQGTVAIPRLAELEVDGVVLATVAGVTLFAMLIVSLIPALRGASVAATAALGEMGRALTAGRSRHRARNALVVAQLALALVLLTGAGLMARSFARLRAVPSGMSADRVFTFRVALPKAVYDDSSSATRFIVRALDEIKGIPGVEAAGVVTKLPLTTEARQDSALFVEDHPLAAGTMPNLHQMVFASPDYFKALGIPILDGRTFDEIDPAKAPRDLIVSRSVAARYWPRDRVVGKRIRMSPFGEWYTIVGVAGDVRGTALEQPPDEIVYIPMVVTLGRTPMSMEVERQWTPRNLAFVVRANREQATLGVNVEDAIRRIDPEVPAYGARPMATIVSQAAARTSLTLLLLAVASGVALTLGAVGIYGVVAYVVSLRTREIAVRLALGARPIDVRRMIARQAGVVVGVGIGIGLIGAFGLTRVLRALLFDVSPIDPPSMFAAAALLGVVAAVATWVPAHRASALDPAQALRAD